MLTKIEVFNQAGENLALSMFDPSSGFLIKDVVGLGPVKADIVSSALAKTDGEQYQTSRVGVRNIVLTLSYEPDYALTSIGELRSQLYRYLMPRMPVTLQLFIDDVHFANVSGRVESFETSHFSKDPEVAVSILCFDPDFVAPTDSSIFGTNTSPDGSTVQTYNYTGTTKTGFRFGVYNHVWNEAFSTLELEVVGPSGVSEKLTINADFPPSRSVSIVTIPREKAAYIEESEGPYSVLFGVAHGSVWPSLYPGPNIIRVKADGTPKEWGIGFYRRFGAI